MILDQLQLESGVLSFLVMENSRIFIHGKIPNFSAEKIREEKMFKKFKNKKKHDNSFSDSEDDELSVSKVPTYLRGENAT